MRENSVTPYTCQFPVELAENDTLIFSCKCVTHGTATTTIQCQSMTISLYAGIGSSVGDLPEKITVGNDIDLEIYHDPSHGVGGANVIDSKTGELQFYQREAGKNIKFRIANDNSSHFAIRNLSTGQDMILINSGNRVTQIFNRFQCYADVSVKGILSERGIMDGGDS